MSLPLPKASTAAIGTVEGLQSMGTIQTIVERQTAITVPGHRAPASMKGE